MTKQQKKYLSHGAKILVTVFLVYWLIFFIDWREVLEHLRSTKLSFVLLFLAFYLSGIAISSYKWRQLALFREFNYAQWFYTRTYLIGTFINNFLPSFIGGDAYRIYALGCKERRWQESSGTVVVDRISGFVGILLLSVFFGVLNIATVSEHAVLVVLIAGALGVFLAIALLLYFYETKPMQMLLTFLPDVVKKYSDKLLQFRNRDIGTRAVLLSIAFAFVGLALTNYMLFLAIGVPVDLKNYLSAIFLISVVASIPVSIGNIGIKEWAYITFFSLFGVSAAAAVTVVLLGRILQMLVSFTALPLYLRSKKYIEKEKMRA